MEVDGYAIAVSVLALLGVAVAYLFRHSTPALDVGLAGAVVGLHAWCAVHMLLATTQPAACSDTRRAATGEWRSLQGAKADTLYRSCDWQAAGHCTMHDSSTGAA